MMLDGQPRPDTPRHTPKDAGAAASRSQPLEPLGRCRAVARLGDALRNFFLGKLRLNSDEVLAE